MRLGWLILLAAALALPAWGQGVSTANGSVVDREGNPVEGVVVTFVAKSKPDVPYKGTTNKKGRYSVSGMFTAKESELWLMSCQIVGFVPISVHIESRTVNRTLVGDPVTVPLGAGKLPPEIVIRPLGSATVDWTLAPQEDVEAELKAAAAEAQAQAQAAATEGAPQKDPWVEALTLASAGSLAESVEFFQKAVEAEPDNAERHETFAKILYRLERRDVAEAQARRAVELEPARVESQLVLFSVAESRGDWAQAKTLLDTALAASPRDTRLLSRRAFVAERTGDAPGAKAAYQKVVEIDPRNAEAWLALANLSAASGNLKESEAAYAKVVEINPEGAHQTYFNLGATIIKRPDHTPADTQRAAAAFRKALGLKPDYARAANELAIALISLGDMEGARSTLESFVTANPSAPEAAQMKAMLQSLRH